ncbi:MAG: DUF4180 domain-containing protein [Clostridiales bacterium]|jgi:hypothetical protein|nr:DUF4180 domain-containing protein [Clostridiales bacterium]
MKIIKNIAILSPDKVILNNVNDALDIMASIYSSHNLSKAIIYLEAINPDLFELKNGILGEILQKYVTYKFKVGFIGDFSKFNSKSLNAFILESNKGDNFFFTGGLDSAVDKLSKP